MGAALSLSLTKDVERALKPWHQDRHGLFPRTFTPWVVLVLVLLVHQRLEQQAVQYGQRAQPATRRRRRRRLRRSLSVRLTREVWLNFVVPFLPRFGVFG